MTEASTRGGRRTGDEDRGGSGKEDGKERDGEERGAYRRDEGGFGRGVG